MAKRRAWRSLRTTAYGTNRESTTTCAQPCEFSYYLSPSPAHMLTRTSSYVSDSVVATGSKVTDRSSPLRNPFGARDVLEVTKVTKGDIKLRVSPSAPPHHHPHMGNLY